MPLEFSLIEILEKNSSTWHKSFINKNAFIQVEANLTEYESKTSLGVSFEPTVVSATVSLGYKF